jgi:ubiquinone/menaquinone biosynthesis C-methylase UbiE
MKGEKYIPALSYRPLTPFYDIVVGTTMRERRFKTALIEHADLKPNQKVLDLACGTGTLAILMKQMHPLARVTGVDGDAEIIKIARMKAKREGVEVRFDEALSFDLPYLDETFERVVSSLFFHHLTRSNKMKTLREVGRVLAPGGRILVADWGEPSNLLMKVASRSVQVLDGWETTADNFAGYLPVLIRDAGFDVTRRGDQFNTLFGTIRICEARKI